MNFESNRDPRTYAIIGAAMGVHLDVHHAQIINYLKATKLEIGLLINFGKTSLDYKRFANTTKKSA
jgi:hypothetical protein